MKQVSSTRLREDVYNLLDQVLATGEPLAIERKGKTLLIVPQKPVAKLSRLRRRPTLGVPAEKIVHMDWSGEWKP